MRINLRKLAEKIFDKYGEERGVEIICHGNIGNLARNMAL